MDGMNEAGLRALCAEAAEVGARAALERLGLGDEGARRDLDELRELLSAWRDAKRSAWKAAVDWVVRAACALVLIAMAYRFGFAELLK